MTWAVRHQGSPRAVEGLTLEQVIEGVQDGLWEPTDEVRGPQDRHWRPLEQHPQLAEAVAEATLPPPSHPEDETRLDMTALIDVTLVLLIFFILTTTYQSLERILEMPRHKPEDPGALRVVKPDEVHETMIEVKAREENGRPVFWIDDRQVAETALLKELRRTARETRKRELVLDAAGVEYGTVVKVIDAAGGAKITKVHFKVAGPRPARPAPAR